MVAAVFAGGTGIALTGTGRVFVDVGMVPLLLLFAVMETGGLLGSGFG